MKETQETWVQSLGQEDPLEKETATHSSFLAWRIPWREESCGLQPVGSQNSHRQLSERARMPPWSQKQGCQQEWGGLRWWAFLIAQSVKNLPAMQETQVQFLGQEYPLEKETATHSSILVQNPRDRGAWQAIVHGVTRVGHDLGTKPPPPRRWEVPRERSWCWAVV